MKTVCIYANQGFSSRYLLQTGIIPSLLAKDKEIRPVILSPNGDEEEFRNNISPLIDKKRVLFEKINHGKYESFFQKKRFHSIFLNLRAFILNGKYDTRTVDDFREIFIRQNRWVWENGFLNYLKGVFWRAATEVFKRFKVLRKLLVFFESFLYKTDFLRRLFDKYSPDLVVVTSLTAFPYNEAVAREAKRRNIPVVVLVLSWDNTTGLGYPGFFPYHVIAWTDTMKLELVELNDIEADKVKVCGIAHFDKYYDSSFPLKKDELFARLGLNPDKKTLFYATKSPKRFPWGPSFVRDIADAVKSGKISEDIQILVRIHPLHYRKGPDGEYIYRNILAEYDKVAGEYDFVKLNIPAVSSGMDFNLALDEMRLVASVLKYSDVMVNMFSTMVLEAAIFDLPSINACIRKWCGDKFCGRQDIMIDYNQTHNRRVADTGGVRTVFGEEELYDAVNFYLKDKGLDREKRKLIVESECGPAHTRGKASECIAEEILKLISR